MTKTTKRERCRSCEELTINGVRCHETGCPEAWKAPHECSECGSTFEPEYRWQRCCSHGCDVAFRGMDCACEGCSPVVAS